jgi:hypothetical protein
MLLVSKENIAQFTLGFRIITNTSEPCFNQVFRHGRNKKCIIYILIANPQGERPLGRPGHRFELS